MGGGIAERLGVDNQLFLYDYQVEKAEQLEQSGHGKVFRNLMDVVKNAEVIILAVKPQNIKEVANKIGNKTRDDQIIVSLLAGTSIKLLGTCFPASRIIRMMPNLPLILGEGVIGLSADDCISSQDKDHLTTLFKPLGKVFWLPEHQFDALTSLAGSGPAFFFVMVESMIEAGIAMGFTSQESQSIVYQMMRGSLGLLEQHRKHPAELKWRVASPQGTTIAGLKKLEEHALRSAIINTFLEAYNRARELSRE